MNALYLTLFVSLVLVVLGLVAFLHSVSQRDHDHADRLSLLPLGDDDVMPNAEGEHEDEQREESPARERKENA